MKFRWFDFCLEPLYNFFMAKNGFSVKPFLLVAVILFGLRPAVPIRAAEVLLRQQDIARAETEAEAALSLNPELPEAHNVFGNILYRQGKMEDAGRAYLRALVLNPEFEKAHYNLGIAWARKGKNEEAVRALEKAVYLDPDAKEPLLNLGNLHLQTGRADRALELYLRAERFDPKNGVLLNNIAVAYFQNGSFALAWEYAKKRQAAGFPVHPDFLRKLKESIH